MMDYVENVWDQSEVWKAPLVVHDVSIINWRDLTLRHKGLLRHQISKTSVAIQAIHAKACSQ